MEIDFKKRKRAKRKWKYKKIKFEENERIKEINSKEREERNGEA